MLVRRRAWHTSINARRHIKSRPCAEFTWSNQAKARGQHTACYCNAHSIAAAARSIPRAELRPLCETTNKTTTLRRMAGCYCRGEHQPGVQIKPLETHTHSQQPLLHCSSHQRIHSRKRTPQPLLLKPRPAAAAAPAADRTTHQAAARAAPHCRRIEIKSQHLPVLQAAQQHLQRSGAQHRGTRRCCGGQRELLQRAGAGCGLEGVTWG